MREVTKEEFFVALYAAPGDIMPQRPEGPWPYRSVWANQYTRKVFGETRGVEYSPGLSEQHYFLEER